MLAEILRSEERRVAANGIEINYQAFGNPAHPPMLLVMGLGMQMTGWRDAFCEQLAAEGLYVIRYDNRDMGHSTWFDEQPLPGSVQLLKAGLFGRKFTPAYTLDDMAADAVGLLDALEIESAHVFGVSMGGMISQLVALNYPERVRSLTSMMSTTGERDLPRPGPRAMRILLKSKPTDRAAYIEQAVNTWKVLNGPSFGESEDDVREFAALNYDRAFHPSGTGRQMAAIANAPGRRAALRQLQVPTLVIHGNSDPLVPLACGIDTADAIPNSRLLVIQGLGHALPKQKYDEVISAIVAHAARVDDRR